MKIKLIHQLIPIDWIKTFNIEKLSLNHIAIIIKRNIKFDWLNIRKVYLRLFKIFLFIKSNSGFWYKH